MENVKEEGIEPSEDQPVSDVESEPDKLESSKEDTPEVETPKEAPKKPGRPAAKKPVVAPEASTEPEAPRLEPTVTDDAKLETEEEDYLRQYQYRKNTKPGSKGSDPQPGSRAAIMKAKLLKQEKVRIMVFRPKGESRDMFHTVNLNGYRLDFPKQQYLTLPQQITDTIEESQASTDEALERQLITGNEDKEAKLQM